MHRLRRFFRTVVALNGTPVGIAGGFTLGLCLSLVPVPFLGMVAALAVAPLLRCNLPATYLGTAVVNPVTGAFFYFAELWLGMALLGHPLPSWSGVRDLDASGWASLFMDLLGPFMIGALVLVTAAAVACFPTLWWLTRRFRRVRDARARDTTRGASASPSPSLVERPHASARAASDR